MECNLIHSKWTCPNSQYILVQVCTLEPPANQNAGSGLAYSSGWNGPSSYLNCSPDLATVNDPTCYSWVHTNFYMVLQTGYESVPIGFWIKLLQIPTWQFLQLTWWQTCHSTFLWTTALKNASKLECCHSIMKGIYFYSTGACLAIVVIFVVGSGSGHGQGLVIVCICSSVCEQANQLDIRVQAGFFFCREVTDHW